MRRRFSDVFCDSLWTCILPPGLQSLNKQKILSVGETTFLFYLNRLHLVSQLLLYQDSWLTTRFTAIPEPCRLEQDLHNTTFHVELYIFALQTSTVQNVVCESECISRIVWCVENPELINTAISSVIFFTFQRRFCLTWARLILQRAGTVFCISLKPQDSEFDCKWCLSFVKFQCLIDKSAKSFSSCLLQIVGEGSRQKIDSWRSFATCLASDDSCTRLQGTVADGAQEVEVFYPGHQAARVADESHCQELICRGYRCASWCVQSAGELGPSPPPSRFLHKFSPACEVFKYSSIQDASHILFVAGQMCTHRMFFRAVRPWQQWASAKTDSITLSGLTSYWAQKAFCYSAWLLCTSASQLWE